jgi:hypothetical protein
MSFEGIGFRENEELLLVVDRLSTQDKGRIVRLVELLNRAPHDLRRSSQRKLRRLLAGESMSHDECLESIDGMLSGIERELVVRDIVLPELELQRAV